MKLVIYTALIVDKSIPLSEIGQFFPFEHDKGDVKYIAYTNRDDLTSDYWEVRKVNIKKGLSPRMMARFLKWNPHKINLPNHTHSLWLDTPVGFKFEPKAILNHYLQDKYHTAIHHHGDLKSIYQEGMVSSYVYKTDVPSIINKQLEKYYDEGHPYIYDHFETAILLRKNCPPSNELSEFIYNEITSGSIRDQIATPYCVRKKRNEGDDGILTINETYVAHNHSNPLPKSQIFFTIPKPSKKLKENLNERNPTK